jgi:HAD superfamily hydrolase (TIGR01509 family)
MIKAVIFDIDGTLVDSVDLHAEAWQEAFKKFGCDVPFERVRYQIGKGGDQLIPVFFSLEDVNRFGKELEAYRAKLFKEKYLPQVRPFPKVRQLFERIIEDGKRIVLGSSARGDELKVYKEIARISDLVEDETTGDDVEKSKPHPDIFIEALSELGNPPSEEVLVVGDTPYDAEAALKAHLHTIGMLCGGFPEEALCASRCIAIYKDPADLLAKYEQSPIAQGLFAAAQSQNR